MSPGTPPNALARHLPPVGAAGGDEILDRFLRWTEEIDLVLYPAQEEAILELASGKHVVLGTPTGSGKSLVALALHFKALAEGQRSFYTSPIKALASEKFFALCRDLGAANVGMLTGDASINPDAPVICCTAEVLANMALRYGSAFAVPYVIMDEFHYYSDRERGWAWQVPLLELHDTTFLLMSATLGDTTGIREELVEVTGREVAEVVSGERPVPLDFEYRDALLHESVEALLDESRAPVYVVNFTQRDCAERAQALTSAKVADRDQKQRIAEVLVDTSFDSPYGKDVERFVRAGIGIHHAGLLPRYRLLMEQLAQQGLLRVICGTDTLGVGVNIPIRTVLFSQLCKFDGQKTGLLGARDFKQIAGRAGRKGFDDRGWVVAIPPAHVVENKRLEAKAEAAGGKKKRKLVRKKAPTRGFVPWDAAVFERLRTSPPEPLEGSFDVTHGMLLNVFQREGAGEHAGYRAVLGLVARAHVSEVSRARLKRRAARIFRSLRQAGILALQPRPGRAGRTVRVAETLQEDFSLHQTLSLYLVEVIETLSPDDPNYALDLLSFVESILENPRALLLRQLDRERGELVGRLKAEGVPYEERMARLDDVTPPRPNEDLIYATFNAFSGNHPWVSEDDIRPKSIARELYEGFYSFDGYVKELGIARSEGLLLRYLNQVFGVLTQTVPVDSRTDPVVEVIAFFRTLLARADSSLLDEWERAAGQMRTTRTDSEAPEHAEPDLSRDRRALGARVRIELHRLVRALAHGEHDEAVRCVVEDPEAPWTAERFEAATAAFREARGALRFDHGARLAEHTRLESLAPHRFEVTQALLGTEDDEPGFLRAEIDLSRSPSATEPLLRLVALEP